jgi:twinkle protein
MRPAASLATPLVNTTANQYRFATYRDATGAPVAQKLRFKDKQFKFIGDTKKAGLYGQHLWRNEGGKMLVITEGEVDALSMSQVQGNRFPVVSVGTGAAGAKKAVANSLEFVESFDRVVIMFDNDEAGRTASQEVAAMLSVGKAAIATLPLKDANEMLMAGKGADLISAMWDAKIYRPDGIIDGQNMWETIMADDDAESIDYPFRWFEPENIRDAARRTGHNNGWLWRGEIPSLPRDCLRTTEPWREHWLYCA